jgi:hypothetical protein
LLCLNCLDVSAPDLRLRHKYLVSIMVKAKTPQIMPMIIPIFLGRVVWDWPKYPLLDRIIMRGWVGE